jgi:hypothetical protein
MPRELRSLATILHVNKLEVCGWGCILRISRCFAILAFAGAILAFVGLSPSTALADSIPPDPGVHLKCPPCTTIILLEPTFSFTVTGGTDQTFDFINGTGKNAIELHLVATNEVDTTTNTTIPTNLAFTCLNEDGGDAFFTTCTPGTNEIKFSGLNSDTGQNGILTATGCNTDGCTSIPTLSHFGVEVSALDIPGKSFVMDATLVAQTPEPSAVLLVLLGIVFLFLFRRTGWIPNLNFKL